MASTSASTPVSLSSSSAFVDNKVLPPRHLPSSAASTQSATLPTCNLTQATSAHSRLSRTTAYCRKIARSVAAMATGEAPAEVVVAGAPDTSEIVKAIQEAWDKVEDKYAVTSLGVAGLVALWGSAGMISAIDKLPLIPGVLEVVGIGYTGWFAYRNLVFRPDREALIQKIKDIYCEVIGSS